MKKVVLGFVLCVAGLIAMGSNGYAWNIHSVKHCGPKGSGTGIYSCVGVKVYCEATGKTLDTQYLDQGMCCIDHVHADR